MIYNDETVADAPSTDDAPATEEGAEAPATEGTNEPTKE